MFNMPSDWQRMLTAMLPKKKAVKPKYYHYAERDQHGATRTQTIVCRRNLISCAYNCLCLCFAFTTVPLFVSL